MAGRRWADLGGGAAALGRGLLLWGALGLVAQTFGGCLLGGELFEGTDEQAEELMIGRTCDEAQCVAFGNCALGPEGACVPASDEHCILSEVLCEKLGACVYREGACRVSARVDIECEIPRGALGVQWCRTYGACRAVEGVCAAVSDADCEISDACGLRGLCVARDGFCVALEDGHCEASRACREMGRCRADHGACVASR